jgi:ABC-2 type transport system permease protein
VLLFVAVLVVVVGGAVLDAHLRLQPLGLVLSVLLAAAAIFALGLWVAAIARTQRAAGAIGAGPFYPMMFFAGVWLPREVMPPALRTVSDLTPIGSAVHAMDISMLAGRFPPTESLLVMAVWAVIFG